MYALTIRFDLPEETDWEEVRQRSVRRAFEVFRDVPGLRAKAFVLSPEKAEIGGNYVFETQDDAEAYLRSDAFQSAVERYGEPRLLEKVPVCAYVEEGDLVFPDHYEAQAAISPEASVPPLGF